MYPSSRETKPPYRVNDFWKARHDFDTADFARELRQEARYPGDSVLLGTNLWRYILYSTNRSTACGDAAFMSKMRSLALKNTIPDRFIKFLEVEFQPPFTEST